MVRYALVMNYPPSEVTRHLTATTFVVHDGRVLLHRHARQGLQLPPGGHVERDELPDHAARREVEEETGLRVTLHSEAESAGLAREMATTVVAQPAFILVEDINPYHQHVDMTYFARVESPDLPEPARRNGFEWRCADTLTADDVPENVRAGARRAIAWAQGQE